MNEHMDDEKFEGFLQREAKTYNEPPATVPRDEMFAAIAAARTARPKTEDRGPKTRHWLGVPRLAWIGMAATLTIGVAIGRYALTRQIEPAPVVGVVSRGASGVSGVSGASGGSGAGNASGVSASVGRSDARPSAGRPDLAGGSYDVAANAELGRAEALLTAYGASPANSIMDQQFSRWARDILENTRLLLDSPAASDPARRKLLQDLELVLVQMVQRSPTAGAAEERSHIDRSLDRTQVLTRLRSALPAGRNNGI